MDEHLKLYIYESDHIEYRTMEAYGFDDLDSTLSREELEFIKAHEVQHEKYQRLLKEILERNKNGKRID